MNPTKTGLYTTNADGRSILLYWDGKDWVNADGLRPRFKTVQWSRGPWFVPALRTWVGLTADELVQIGVATGLERAAAEMISNKLKEKNNG